MSIIYDALKKVQQATPPVPTGLTRPYRKERLYETPFEIKISPPKQNKTQPILILLCAIMILGSLGFLYKELAALAKPIETPSLPESVAESATLSGSGLVPSPAVAPAISNMPKPKAPLMLNIHGIMSNAKGNIVLINDQVYQEGDDVDGVKIVKINLNSITVIHNGKEETIRVKN